MHHPVRRFQTSKSDTQFGCVITYSRRARRPLTTWGNLSSTIQEAARANKLYTVVESDEFCPFFEIFPSDMQEDMLRVRWAISALNLESVIFVVQNVSQHVAKKKEM